jgi:hypothetical protein
MTHTYVTLAVSLRAYNEIKDKLVKGNYAHVFTHDNLIDMSGIALDRQLTTAQSRERGLGDPIDPNAEHECTRCGTRAVKMPVLYAGSGVYVADLCWDCYHDLEEWIKRFAGRQVHSSPARGGS